MSGQIEIRVSAEGPWLVARSPSWPAIKGKSTTFRGAAEALLNRACGIYWFRTHRLRFFGPGVYKVEEKTPQQ